VDPKKLGGGEICSGGETNLRKWGDGTAKKTIGPYVELVHCHIARNSEGKKNGDGRT